MEKTDRLRQAEAVLQAILPGMEILGVNFGRGFFVSFAAFDSPDRRVDEVQVQIESRWTLFPTPPDQLPEHEAELPSLSTVEAVSLLAGLQGQPIRDVRLGEHQAHLLIAFASGALLFVHGNHQHYESWNARITGDRPDGAHAVVALPGGDVAVFVADEASGPKRT